MTDDCKRELSGAVNQMYQDCPISDLIGEAMSEPENSPEHKLGNAIQGAFDCLDTIMKMAADQNTREMVRREQIMLGQLLTRARILGGLILPPQEEPGKLRLVQNV